MHRPVVRTLAARSWTMDSPSALVFLDSLKVLIPSEAVLNATIPVKRTLADLALFATRREIHRVTAQIRLLEIHTPAVPVNIIIN